MKTYTYHELPGVGPGELEQQGSLLELLQSIPYLLTRNRLPPLVVLNAVLEGGEADAGMSGGARWAPFSIDQQEYMQLARQCRELGLEITEPPAWVKDRTDFVIWEFELDHGVPSSTHKDLSDLECAARAKLNAAIESGAPQEEINRLHFEAFEAGNALAEFLDGYLEKD